MIKTGFISIVVGESRPLSCQHDLSYVLCSAALTDGLDREAGAAALTACRGNEFDLRAQLRLKGGAGSTASG